MIQVDEKETIRRLHFIKRHSIRRIARELNHSRKTVRKAVEDGSVPQYRRSKPRVSPVMGPYLDKIGEWLEEDKERSSKQRHTAHRIYVRLKSELGFTGAERTVRLQVSALRQRLSQLAIPCDLPRTLSH